MSTLVEFHRQRARVLIPKSASSRHMRRWRRQPGMRRIELTFRGILPKPTRTVLVRQSARHANIVDPFRRPPRRKGRRKARMAGRTSSERAGRSSQLCEVLSTLDLVHRARGRVGFAPAPSWHELPVVGR